MKYCHICGNKIDDDAAFCYSCGAKQTNGPTEPATDTSQHQTFAQDKAVGQKEANGVVSKVKAFESKHNVITNVIVLVCAIVVLFVALFAPIKVPYYTNALYEQDEKEIDIYYTEVDQTIFQMIGALFYFNAGEERAAELNREYYEIVQKAQVKAARWMSVHPHATTNERNNAHIEFIADGMSDMNYLGYMIATTRAGNNIDGMLSVEAIITAVFGIAIALIAIIVAILSLVYIIKSIINLIKKKPQPDLFKYLCKTLSASMCGLLLMFCAPMMKAGGNMFIVTLFTAIAILIAACVGGVLAGKDHQLVIAKRASVALLSMIAFFILCSNVFAIKNTGGVSLIRTLVPTGFGLHSILSVVQFGETAPGVSLMIANMLTGFILYIVLVLTVTLIGCTMIRALRRLAFGGVKASSVTGCAVASVVFGIISIVLGLMSATLTGGFYKLFDITSMEVTVKWLVRAQVWVSVVITLAVTLFGKFFLPNDVVKGKTPQAPQQSEQQPESSGTPQ